MRTLFALLSVSLLAQGPSTRVRPVAIVGATVVDPSGVRVPDAIVILRGDRIEQVGTRKKVKIPEGALEIPGAGKFLIPGLIDAHVHFFQSGGLYTRPDGFDLRAFKPYAEDQKAIREGLNATFARYLRCGVTSVADVGGPMSNFDVRDLAARSDRAPRVAATGPLISSISREALDLSIDPVTGKSGPGGDPPIIKCATPEEAVALVRREAEKKPDFIKIWYVVTPQETVAKNRPVVRATIQESHRLGLRVAVHATELASARAALEEGADILVHSVEDQDVDESFLKLAKERKVVYIPTLIVGPDYARTMTQQFAFRAEELAWGDAVATGSLFDVRHLPAGNRMGDMLRKASESPKPIAERPVLAKNLVKVFRAGITVAMGTDAGNIGTLHGPSVFREMATMEAAGLTPLEVLRTATAGGAEVMGHGKDLGRISPGALADLVLLDADPALSTGNLSRISSVIRNGQWLDPASLLSDGPEAIVQRQLNAYNARDLEAFCALYADDVRILGLDGNVQARGMDAFKARYRDRFEKAPKLHCEVIKRMVRGNVVIDEERITGREPEPVMALAVYDIQNGKIATVRFIR
jgi:imidazolonepropionase-like amidohydrolase